MRHAVLAIALVALGSAATAEVQCNRDLLLGMAAEILEKRGDLRGFSGNRIGGNAAYFMLRYGDKSPEKIKEALQTGRPFRDVDELFMAQRITKALNIRSDQVNEGTLSKFGRDAHQTIK